MANSSDYTTLNQFPRLTQKEQLQTSKILQALDETLDRLLPEKDPLETFLIALKRRCISTQIKEISSMLPTQPELILVTEPIQLEPGTLVVVESRLGWDINFNDLYLIEEIKGDSYLVRDNGYGKAWNYTYNKFWTTILAKQEQGCNAYIMSPNHPEYWSAKIQLGINPPHPKKEIARVAVDARKVIREMVDWRDMLKTQDHLVFHNCQEKLVPVALEGYINEIPVEEIENTDFLNRSDSQYANLFSQTTFVFKTEKGSLVNMNYDELVNQRWVQIEMGY
ncbi:hypothetical protein PCC7424_4633 [Gloeothece citriformis PCC 7424]|uniref:Uncharacterized protein n=1 Tax=Gloeothece citriformis (strain PCC 7424) TaxID=65393 RepID=B7KBL7_GLOC7|nr:hypothetical protein [Gloeothece citriformis]ACK72995.1 hypothetical protein PCC7424_4633 [Gloeothece citriformis PCC 7424]